MNTSVYENSQGFKDDLLKSSEIKQKTSVFFINKEKAVNNLEKKYPNLKIVNIETTFPNGLKFHLAQREELYATKNSLDFYSIMDSDFKILNVISKAEFQNLSIKPIEIEFVDSQLINLSQGEFIKKTQHTKMFEDLSKSLLINSRDVIEQKTIFKEMILLDNMLKITLRDGFEIKVYNPQQELHKKTTAMMLRMGQIYPNYQNDYVLEIYLTQDGELLSQFTLKN